jgi:regulatory protein
MTTEKQKPIDKKTALLKAAHWCAYQERAQQELRDKLYEWSLRPNEVEEIISELIAQNYINEERFALAYVSGKVRIKKWGVLKIKSGLKQKQINDRLIKKALASIDFDEYQENLLTLLAKKEKTEGEKNPIKRQYKLLKYLQSKGYENDLIFLLLKNKHL